MRYNATATLYKETVVEDDYGNLKPTKGEPSEVFCNVYSVNLSSYMAAREAGLHADAEIQLRSIDYNGENIVSLESGEYTVERVQDEGEFTRLTLARRLSNEQ